MTRKPTFKQRISYQFDNLMAAGTPAMIGMLGLLSLVVVLTAAVVIRLLDIRQPDDDSISFLEAAWLSLLRTLDAGTMADDAGPEFRLVMLLVTIGGIFVVSSLIGILSSAIEGKLDELRKGRSIVLEENHTVILGWSPQVFTIIEELVIANENQKRPAIAILSETDKIEMQDEIRVRVETLKNTRVICRSGNPVDPSDLEIVSPHTARSIIVIPPEVEQPDTFVIKTILAITNSPYRHEHPYHIVTQIREPKSLHVLKMVDGRDEIKAILVDDVIARVTAQTSRQSGLSVVYTELLGFGGDELYFHEEPMLSGRTYGDSLLAYEASAVIGIQRAGGTVEINPDMTTRYQPGDKVIAVSADDDTVKLSGLNVLPLQETLIRANRAIAQATRPEKALILGWNHRGSIILRELDHYVVSGSQVLVLADEMYEKPVSRCKKLSNQGLVFQPGDPTDRELLDSLNIKDYDHVIVLADTRCPTQESDARTLVTLLHLRDIVLSDETPFSIVSEMLDLRNRQLAEVTRVDDFIVSDHLVSLITAQVSENGALLHVFEDLFEPQGAETYLKPISDYVALDEPVNFYTIVEAARRRGETAIGYRIMAESSEPAKAYGVHTNPNKAAQVTFSADDKVIVMAHD
jgi:voltage-gated potassium channel Kch